MARRIIGRPPARTDTVRHAIAEPYGESDEIRRRFAIARALRYEAVGEPAMKALCHCRECQYITGGGPNLFMAMPIDGFRYTKGTPKQFARKDLEKPVTREFCPECGTHVITRPAAARRRHREDRHAGRPEPVRRGRNWRSSRSTSRPITSCPKGSRPSSGVPPDGPGRMHRIARQPLTRFAQQLFEAGGLETSRAESVARLLVLTDMMGRPTHGLAACKPYLEQLGKGQMSTADDPEVVRDDGATIVWDGRYAPGLWAARTRDRAGLRPRGRSRRRHARDPAQPSHRLPRRADARGHVARLLHHAAVLRPARPLRRAARRQGSRCSAPTRSASGSPRGATPVLVDTSASLTTVSMTREKAAAGTEFEQPWLIDADGRPTRDPRVFRARATARQPAAARRPGGRSQGLRLRTDGRGADAGPRRPRSAR